MTKHMYILTVDKTKALESELKALPEKIYFSGKFLKASLVLGINNAIDFNKFFSVNAATQDSRGKVRQ